MSLMNSAELATILGAIGCPTDRVATMAAQLEKRARQLSAKPGKPYEEALSHLLELMRKGWAAQERGR